MTTVQRRLISVESWQQAAIDDYVNDVAAVWGHHDADRTMIDVWLRVVQHSSKLGEFVRRGKFDDAQAQLGRVAIWMLTFASKGQTELEGTDAIFRLTRPLSYILWRKFPNCCHACFTRRVALAASPEDWKGRRVDCDCILTLAETEDRSVLLTSVQKQQAREARRKYADELWNAGQSDYGRLSLRDLEERFAGIFKRNIFALDLEHVTFHFLEEVGEVAEALTALYTYKKPKETPAENLKDDWQSRRFDLEDELADSFSWLFAVSSKFCDVFGMFDSYTKKSTRFAEKMYISEHLRVRHMRDSDSLMACWDCKSEVCSCPIKLVLDPHSAASMTGASA